MRLGGPARGSAIPSPLTARRDARGDEMRRGLLAPHAPHTPLLRARRLATGEKGQLPSVASSPVDLVGPEVPKPGGVSKME